METGTTGLEIAVIGMAGRFPGAENIHEFWENLKNGIESISFFANEELAGAGVQPLHLEQAAYVKARGVLASTEYFDPTFFNITPREAEITDPQLRIFHECAWQALEDAGCNPDTYNGYNGSIGLYAGNAFNHYWLYKTIYNPDIQLPGEEKARLLNTHFSTLVSYNLDLKGPSLTIYTACSTSLVTIHTACLGILSGECRMALAGGVSIVPSPAGYFYGEGSVSSPDGHCRAFDARAEGSVFGDGVGVVVLKRLDDALADGDSIYAVIKGTAVNNDGIRKLGYTAPSVAGQVGVLKTAYMTAEIEPHTVTYIETHGTGTQLGDPVEIEALKMVFAAANKQSIAIGSVKTNLGHLNTAAGVTGFIKTVLSLKHRLIPPTLHFQTPSSKIDFERTPFYVNTRLKAWDNGGKPLRAGISSFGLGGTNAHAVLEEPPQVSKANSQDNRHNYLILLSAQTRTALERATQNLVTFLTNHPAAGLADAAYTLQVGRKSFQYRKALVCSTRQEAIHQLSSPPAGKVRTAEVSKKVNHPFIVFMFPGVGSQYVDMGKELYQHEPVFRQEIDRCFEILKPLMGHDIKEILYPFSRANRSDMADKSDIHQSEIAQPLLFAFEYALAKLLMGWGIRPTALIGYSFGEYTAACVSGVFSVEDALKLVVSRAELIGRLPPGAMLSVPLTRKQVEPFLTPSLSTAVDNGESVVVSGSLPAVEMFAKKMRNQGLICMPVDNSHALHSPMMEPILKEFEIRVGQLRPGKPRIPYISNVTGNWITVEQAINPAYWAQHLGSTVCFSQGAKELVKEKNSLFLEIGPGNDLGALMLRHINMDLGHRVINLVRRAQKRAADLQYLLERVGQLWLYGVNVDWERFHAGEKRQRIHLPTYPFEKQVFSTNRPGREAAPDSKAPGSPEDYTIYVPSWKPSLILPGRFAAAGGFPDPKLTALRQNASKPEASAWLLLLNRHPFSGQWMKYLESEGKALICVFPGPGFKQIDQRTFTINPGDPRDYDSLINHPDTLNRLEGKIIHLWDISDSRPGEPGINGLEPPVDQGFYSLLHLAQALARLNISPPGQYQIIAVTNNMQRVFGETLLFPGKALILGALKTIPREVPSIRCASIDIVLPEPGSLPEKELLRLLAREVAAEDPEPEIVLRGYDRLVRTYEPMPPLPSRPPTRSGSENGVYLITGGPGGNGYPLARYLAGQGKLNLLFIESPDTGKNKPDAALPLDIREEAGYIDQKEEELEEQLPITEITGFPGLEEHLTRFCLDNICHYFKANINGPEPGHPYHKNQLKKELGILPKFEKFYNFFINQLLKAKLLREKDGQIEFLSGFFNAPDPAEKKKIALESYPQFKGTFAAIEYCVRHYKPALSGEIEAVGVLYPEGHYFRELNDYQDTGEHNKNVLYYLLLKEIVFKALEKSPAGKTFRILEVGGGNGILTRVLVPDLAGRAEGGVEYHFTDLGKFFIIKAQKEAISHDLNFMKFSQLDIAKDPLSQGCEAHAYDMILALNVVHATRRIEETISHLKTLLAPRGIMALIEITNPPIWTQMLNGLAEGWWYFEDGHIRRDSPLLSLHQWEEVLKNQDFQHIEVFPRHREKRRKARIGLILAQAKESGSPGENSFQGPLEMKLRDLEQLGARVRAVTADLSDPLQMQTLISRARETFGPVKGIIHTPAPGSPCPLMDLSREMLDKVLTPAVKGTLVLADMFKNKALDFFIIIPPSQTRALAVGQLGEAAANAFLEAFAYAAANLSGPVITVITGDFPRVARNPGQIMNPITANGFPVVTISREDLTGKHPQSPGQLQVRKSEEPDLSFPLEKTTPSPNLDRPPRLSSPYIPPQDDIQQAVADIFQDFFGFSRIGIEDDFFELGFDSLIATSLVSTINKRLNLRLPLVKMYRTSTIEELAELIKTLEPRDRIIDDENIVLLKESPDAEKHFFLVHDGVGEIQGYLEFCHLLNTGHNCWAIRVNPADYTGPRNISVEEIAGQYIHKIKKIQAQGPYHIAGWSFGGILAFEVIRQLEAMKEETGILGIIDIRAPHPGVNKKIGPFTLESELKWVQEYLADKNLTQKLLHVTDIDQLWQQVTSQLEQRYGEKEAGREKVKRLIPKQLHQAIPHIDRLNLKSLVSYLNIMRTFDSAHRRYVPPNKIGTPLHHFQVTKPVKNSNSRWDDFCHLPIIVHSVPGTHFTLFQHPHVIELARIFTALVSR